MFGTTNERMYENPFVFNIRPRKHNDMLRPIVLGIGFHRKRMKEALFV